MKRRAFLSGHEKRISNPIYQSRNSITFYIDLQSIIHRHHFDEVSSRVDHPPLTFKDIRNAFYKFPQMLVCRIYYYFHILLCLHLFRRSRHSKIFIHHLPYILFNLRNNFFRFYLSQAGIIATPARLLPVNRTWTAG